MVINNGPEDAANVVVNDNLPRGVDYVSNTTTVGDFDVAAGEWAIGDLANGESAMLQITSVARDAAAVQTNIALVSSDTEDPNAENDVAIDSIDAVAADLEITKTVDEPAPDLGDVVVWTIEVVNNGPDTAEHVVIKDMLPEGTTFISSSDENFDEDVGEFALGDLESGESASVHITVRVDDADGARINIASVSSDTYDDVEDNNVAEAETDAVAADLELDKGVIPPQEQGDTVEWTISVTNTGPDAATGVTVQDILPDGVSFTGFTAGDETPHISFLGDSWLAADFLPGAIVDPVVGYIESQVGSVTSENFSISGHTAAEMLAETSWQPALQNTVADSIFVDFGVNEFIAGTLPSDYQSDLEELFGVLADVSPTSEVVFFIPAETSVVDPVAPWSEYVDAAVAATTAAGATAINLGEFIPAYADDSALWEDSHHIGVEAADVVVQALAEGFSLPEPEFDAVEGIWSVGNLAVGETATLTIEAEVVDSGELVNIAQVVASDQVDPDSVVDNLDGVPSEDDEDSAALSVIDLELTQTITDGQTEITSADVGDTVVFEITVANESTVPATGVAVSTLLADLASSGALTLGESNGEFDPVSGDWIIGDLAPDEEITLAVDAVVNTPGDFANIAQVDKAMQLDVDSTPGNSDPDEDEQAVVSLEVVDPNPVPVAVDDIQEVTATFEPLNAVIMVDHSGSTGTDSAGPDGFSPGSRLGKDLFDQDGNLISRLELVRQAVEDFAGREQISFIKILGFDAAAGGDGNVSEWFDVTGEVPVALEDFLGDFVADRGTNYTDALRVSQEEFLADPSPNGLEVNYYLLSDGIPVERIDSEGNQIAGAFMPNDVQIMEWEMFAGLNFNNAYGVGYGEGAGDFVRNPNDPFIALDAVSHADDPNVAGLLRADPGNPTVHEEENTLLANEADGLPAELFRTISESAVGNVFDNDDPGADGTVPGVAVESISIDNVLYTYDGSSIASSGSFPGTSQVVDGFFNIPLESGGRFAFNFTNGDYEYFTPLVDSDLTEEFVYTIRDSASPDGQGDSDSATLTINVAPALLEDPAPLESQTFISDDELFTSNVMNKVSTSGEESTNPEWSGDDSMYYSELYDMTALL